MSEQVAVLMAVHAGETAQNLREAIESLTRQTLQPDQVILVEDGPIGPGLASTIDELRRVAPIHSVRLPENRGLAAALNEGLRATKAELVARLDSDDKASPQRLSRQVEAFRRNQELDVLGSYAIEIDLQGRRGATRKVPITHESIVAALWANPLLHPTVMFRRARVLMIGGYDERLRRGQDYELWFRAAISGLRFANIPEALTEYRSLGTPKRLPVSTRWRQALIGFRGSRAVGLPVWKQMACFAPFLRALLPRPVQILAYRVTRRFRPH